MKQLISTREIYFNALKDTIEYFRENKSKFNMLIVPTKETPILPNEAYTPEGFIFAEFDFGAEETWTADQILLENFTFSCVLVYSGVEGWQEYQISVPIEYISAITKPDNSIRSTSFIVTKEDKEFEIKVQNSKRKLKIIRSSDE